MGKLVLLIDDDRLPMQYYAEALRQKGFKVKQYFEPDGALDFVGEKGSQIAAIILDIMLPPGRYGADKTNEGLRTGVFLLKDLREKCANVPVVVLTNVRNPNTLDEFEKGPLLKVVQKMNCPPFELAELVDEIVSIDEHKSDPRDKVG